MVRSIWKGPFNSTVGFCCSRSSFILPAFSQKHLLISHKNQPKKLLISELMFGFKVGSFLSTRKKSRKVRA